MKIRIYGAESGKQFEELVYKRKSGRKMKGGIAVGTEPTRWVYVNVKNFDFIKIERVE